MKKIIFTALKVILAFYVLICIAIYFLQEKFIFFPEKLDAGYKFEFTQPFEEINIKTANDLFINGLLFESDSAKGLIIYFHGNAGSLSKWGNVAHAYTKLNYDVLIIDYPGYGKSSGAINGEKELFSSLQTVYDSMKTRYDESKIIVLGYSIGTGPAAKIASDNHPKLLILQAPYYNLADLMKNLIPVVPTFILKYKFETNEYLHQCKIPVVVFHGNEDEVIYYGSSLKLKEEMKQGDTLITLTGQGHNGMTENPEYIQALTNVLSK